VPPEVEDRTGTRAPAARRLLERIELVEPAGAPVEEQRVPVAAAFDVHAARNRVRAPVALVRVVERNARPRRLPRHYVERDPDPAALVEAGAEVRVHRRVESD